MTRWTFELEKWENSKHRLVTTDAKIIEVFAQYNAPVIPTRKVEFDLSLYFYYTLTNFAVSYLFRELTKTMMHMPTFLLAKLPVIRMVIGIEDLSDIFLVHT